MKERTLLEQIIETRAIRTVFQPIVNTAGAIVVGYEALSRGPAGTLLETPDALFAAANEHNLLWDLEVACRSLALERAREQHLHGYLFINVDSRVLYDPKFREGLTAQLIDEHSLDPEQIVFEITEKTSIGDYRAFREALRHYTRQGYKIAIDDAGAGYSGMRTIAETHPQFIKLDMGLIRGIDKDPLKQGVARHFIGMCQGANMKLIAEGVETPGELATLMELGVEYVQGYLLGRPQSEIVRSLSPEVREQMDLIRAERARLSYSPSSYSIGLLARLDKAISEQANGKEAQRMLAENGVQGLAVVRDGYPVGLVMKHSCDALLATPYGNALYLNKSLSFLMDRSPLIVEYDTALSDVARQAMSRREEKLYDYVIVVNQGKYYGIITIKRILEKMSQLETNYARHLNPLTGLPGNRLIHERMDELLSTTGAVFAYVDIDNFKAYNDVYGFERGDGVIQRLGNILANTVERHFGRAGFVGHIGGDDFVVALIGDLFNVQSFCRDVINAFEQTAQTCYHQEDLRRGYVQFCNREGKWSSQPLMTLSVAVVLTRPQEQILTATELSQLMTGVKATCKAQHGSCYVIMEQEGRSLLHVNKCSDAEEFFTT